MAARFCHTWALALLLTPLLAVGPAAAQQSLPAAVVEEAPDGASVMPFDYLWRGDVITLGAGQELVLGYLSSCMRETVVGGKVEIGKDASRIKGGSVIREAVECDGGQDDATAAASGESGVVVFRAGPKDPEAPQLIYSVSPAFTLPAGIAAREIEIVRRDMPGSPKRFPVKAGHVDLHGLRRSLSPGSYEVHAGSEVRYFKIVAWARQGGPLVARLIRF